MEENIRILVVDDDPCIRQMYQQILSPSLTEDILSEGASLFGDLTQKSEPVARKWYNLSLADRGEEAVKAVKKVVKKKRPFAAAYAEFPNHAHWVIGEPSWQEIPEYVPD